MYMVDLLMAYAVSCEGVKLSEGHYSVGCRSYR